MLSAAPLHRRLAPLAGVSIALVSACLLPAAAGAAGFSGSFNPANWSIVNVGGGLDQTLSGSGNPPGYTCVGNQVACAENVDANTGAVDVVGSTVNSPGGGSTTTPRTTTWTVSNGAQSSTLQFSWAFGTPSNAGATNLRAWYLVGTNATQITARDGDFGSVSSISLAPFETFGFRVSTDDNSGDYGVLSITNFMATPTEVPAPLPLAGAAATFHWSRRLRRRRLALRP
jgi:hypothetical protein